MTDIKTISRTDGKASVLLDIIKTPSSNITDVANKVKTRVQQIAAVKNGDVVLKPSLDREQDLNLALKGLVHEGLFGCLFLHVMCIFLLPQCTFYVINCFITTHIAFDNNGNP